MADGKDKGPESTAEADSHEPKEPKLVLPTGLQIAGWTIPLVIGIVGAVKAVTDMTIAAQQEIRARAAAEISFFDKQYEYATKLALDDRGQGLLHASVDAMLNRRQPDFYVNRMFDWNFGRLRDQALLQVCAARSTAFDIYKSEAAPKASAYFRTRWDQYVQLAQVDPQSPAAKLMAYEKTCVTTLAEPESVAEQAAPAVPAPPASAAASSPPAAAPGSQTKTASSNPPPPGAGPAAPGAVPAEVVDCTRPPTLPAATGAATTFKTHGSSGTGWDVDVFWCGHDEARQEQFNYAMACQAYGKLAARSEVGGETLGRLRLRRMPVTLQRKGLGYPDHGTTVSYDIGQVSEQLLADQIGRTAWPGSYKLRPSASGTRWYMSMFACGPNG